MCNNYAVTDRNGKFIFAVDEQAFIDLTTQEIVLDATWGKHVAKFGLDVFTKANSDYVLN